MKNKHSVSIQWSEQDQVYIATVPEIEGLNAFGSTPEEALKELEVAAELFIQVMREDGEEIPEAVVYSNFSGQLRLRIPKSLHASLSREAKGEGISLNTYINHLLAERNAFQMVAKEIKKNNRIIAVTRALTSTGTSDEPFIIQGEPEWKNTKTPTAAPIAELFQMASGSRN